MNTKSTDDKKVVFQSISTRGICNALTELDLPLSDLVHGLYHVMPPELLHVSGNGLIMYMFASLERYHRY